MPIYQYECTACGHRQEALQKLNDAPLSECDACGKPTLKKSITAASFRLSGSGWYETDFKSDNQRNIASQDSAKPADKKEKESKTAATAKNAAGDASKKVQPATSKPAEGKSAGSSARSS